MQTEDIFKYLFQSSFGCEHLVLGGEAALDYIKREYKEGVSKTAEPYIEALDGEYSRVYLSYLNRGLKTETLAQLFCLSAKKEPCGREKLEQKLEVARGLINKGELPIDSDSFAKRLEEWKGKGYPAVHHSGIFRNEYRPAYRVVANRYANYMRVFSEIDKLLCKGPLTLAIEGGSASGKTTLAGILQEVYDCNVFHMDDFFLRPEQRTPQRFKEIGGNVDRERFFEEVLQFLQKGEAVSYRPYDCSTQSLGDVITVPPKMLTVVEGVYSAHPAFSRYYGLSVFMDIDPDYQRKRILKRNSPRLAERFFNEWIPLENMYFSGTDIKDRIDLLLNVNENGKP